MTNGPTSARPRRAPFGSGAFSAGAWLAILVGVLHAARLAWATDDAFISFRYADNLVRGLGLVYNAGERVEGYSNFLWTLWCAAGISLGASPVVWSIVWGIACYAATLALLARFAADRRARAG